MAGGSTYCTMWRTWCAWRSLPLRRYSRASRTWLASALVPDGCRWPPLSMLKLGCYLCVGRA
eukprot:3842640-Pyramimonas_sp.AAC.1